MCGLGNCLNDAFEESIIQKQDTSYIVWVTLTS